MVKSWCRSHPRPVSAAELDRILAVRGFSVAAREFTSELRCPPCRPSEQLLLDDALLFSHLPGGAVILPSAIARAFVLPFGVHLCYVLKSN